MIPERDLDELLGAFALDAIDDDERIEVETYLDSAPRARTEVERHREVASLLAYSGAKAPSGLWDRISGSLYEQSAPPISLVSRRRRGVPTWVASAAAAVVFGVLGVGIGRGLSPTRVVTAADAMALAFGEAMADPLGHHVSLTGDDGMKVPVVVLPSGVGFVAGGMLPPAGEGRTWQLWGEMNGNMVSLGVLGDQPGIASFSCGQEMPTSLAITKEQAGGVTATEQEPMLTGDM